MSGSRLSVGMTLPQRLIAGAAALAVGMTAAACSSASAHGSAHKSTQALRSIACPSDVELQLVLTHACFTLATPVDRRHPSGPKVSLFVLRLTPPGATSRDPMLVLGTDSGDAPGYGGMAALPERVHRVTYIVDPRGVGHSTPLQTCPEASKVAALTTDESASLATASLRCLARLRAAGEDPALFGPDGVAADAVDLRHALGLSSWNLITFGSASVNADALVRRDAGAVRSLVEDSPSPAATSSAAQETGTAYARLVAECRSNVRCRRYFPHIADLWRQASAQLRHQPMAVAGGKLDDGALSKVVRTMLAGDGPAGPAALPAALTTVIRGRVPASMSGVLSRDAAACVGFRAECQPSVSLAVFLTATCSNLATDPVYAKACSGWPSTTRTGTATHVPTLVLFGALDPYVDAHSLLASASHGMFVVQVPHQTHNALGFDDCPIAIRNAWVDQPGTAPPTDCLTGMRPLPFVTS
jgi:pimeloyl-ACP methyl ester carboxylesterase